MRDISKKLTIINTGERKDNTSGTSSAQAASYGGGVGGVTIGGGLYLPKATWDKVFEIKSTSSGEEYLFGKLPIALQYGLTMYVDGEMIELPSIAQGLPFDGRTIWYNPDTNQIEVIGGTGGGGGEGGVSNFWDLTGIPSWITNSKPKYTYTEIEGTPDLTKYALKTDIPSLSGYATESWVTKQNYATKATTLSGYGITDAYTKTNVDDLLKSYVTIAGSQTITGEKNFTGGLKVNGSPIYYDSAKKYWKLEGDLLVTGAMTMYGSDSSFTPSTIMDAILYDSATLGINSNGQLYVKGGAGGGINTTDLQNYLTQNSYLNVTSGDNRYLKLSGGTITGGENDQVPLAISNTASTLRIGFVRNNEVLGFLGFIEANKPLFYDTDGNGRLLLHERNYSQYALPLSGGILDGVLTLRASSSSSDSWIEFSNKSNSVVHKLGVRRPESTYGLQYYNGSEYYNIWHEGNFTPSNYLPLSGGTITSASPVSVTLNANNDGQTALFLQSKGTNKTYVGWDINRGTCLYDFSSDSHFGILNGIPRFNSNTIWHSGNDGDGSGLEADTIGTYKKDSGEKTIIYGTRSDNSNIRRIYDNGWNLMCQNGSDNGAIATLNSNVASATKLQTARTIWGQSFDGTGNVDGKILLTSWDNDGVGLRFNNNTKGVAYISMYAADGNAYAFGQNGNRFLINHNVYGDIFNVLNGNVGFGTAHPACKVEINSSDAMSLKLNSSKIDWGFAYNSIGIYHSNSQKGGFGWNSESASLSNVGFYFKNYVSGDCISLTNEGGIYLIGNVLVSGGLTFYSMRKLKNVVDERGLSLSELSTIKPTRYTWKDGRDNRLHFGGIADDIQQVLPEVVYSTSDGILTMDYGNAAFAVASSLIKPVVDHDKRIAMLEEENKQLRLEIERLKSA